MDYTRSRGLDPSVGLFGLNRVGWVERHPLAGFLVRSGAPIY